MPLYRYKAAGQDSEILEGEVEARDQFGAVERLQAMGYIALRVDEMGTAAVAGRWRGRLGSKRISQDGVAVFTVRNTGKAGEGDMVSATQYRIMVDGIVVEAGTIQLLGNTSIQITYSGTGTVTLEADQQTGHPGKSQPQATVSCSA